MRNRITGYATVTTLTLLNHLYTAYGNITPADLADNDAKLKTPFDASQPIETLFEQVEDAVNLTAAAQAPYTPEQIVAYAYNTIFQTGLFPDACRDWRRRPANEKTWVQFKIDFTIAHQEFKETQQTTRSAGYHTAKQVSIDHHDTMEILANLATATASDCSAMSHLSSTNSQLSTALAATAAQLKTAQADILALQQRLASMSDSQAPPSNGTKQAREKATVGLMVLYSEKTTQVPPVAIPRKVTRKKPQERILWVVSHILRQPNRANSLRNDGQGVRTHPL